LRTSQRLDLTRGKASRIGTSLFLIKYRYIVEQYFGISHLHDHAWKARFPKMVKNKIDIMFRQFAFNLKKGCKILENLPA